MSKDTGFSITSSERYSLALYELSEENNLVSEIESQSLSLLTLIDKSNDFYNLIKNPTISEEALLKIINKISEFYKFNNLFVNFLFFLIKKRRFFFVKRILTSFVEICSKKRGELKAELKSAKELSIDKSLIGGLVVQVGSTMVDASIKNKLHLIENRMMEA